jgi:NAD-reducing hydrogenase large subunit
MSVRIPHTAAQLRRMLNLAQMVQSHALSFFYLSSPDCCWAWSPTRQAQHLWRGGRQARAGPRRRRAAPLRPAHHRVAGRQAHPSRMGCSRRRHRAAVGRQARRDSGHASRGLRQRDLGAGNAYKQIADTFKPEIEVFANFPSNYMSLINEDESIEFTDGALRLIDPRARSSRTASPRAGTPRSSAKPSSPTATPSSPTTSRSAIPRAAIAWARWRG